MILPPFLFVCVVLPPLQSNGWHPLAGPQGNFFQPWENVADLVRPMARGNLQKVTETVPCVGASLGTPPACPHVGKMPVAFIAARKGKP